MKKRTIYHQTFFEMIPEQIEYTLFHAMESVLAYSANREDVSFTKQDKQISQKIEPDEILREWDNLSRLFKQNIIDEAIEFGQTDGYDSGINSTFTDEALVHISSFWNKGGTLQIKDIKIHLEWLCSVEVLEKTEFE